MGQNNTLVEVRRLLDAQTMTHYSASSASAITNTLSAKSLGAVNAISGSEAPPLNWVRLATIEFQITTIAGGATSLFWYLSRDNTGFHAITPPVTTTWYVVSGTTATAVALIDAPYVKITGLGSAAAINLMVATNVGTCNLAAYLHWQSNTQPPALTPHTS